VCGALDAEYLGSKSSWCEILGPHPWHKECGVTQKAGRSLGRRRVSFDGAVWAPPWAAPAGGEGAPRHRPPPLAECRAERERESTIAKCLVFKYVVDHRELGAQRGEPNLAHCEPTWLAQRATNYLPMSRLGLPPKSGVSRGPRPPGTTPGAHTTFTRAAGGAGKKSALAFFHLKILFGRGACFCAPVSLRSSACLPPQSLARWEAADSQHRRISLWCLCLRVSADWRLDGV
jgi:hypothetical protein